MGEHVIANTRWGRAKRWLYTTNHKDIGTLYFWFALAALFIAGGMSLIMRAELAQPGLKFVQPEFYNSMVTMHGLIMIFGAIMPALAAFANWQIPLMLGAPDMAFPRLNNWSFWLLPFAFTLLLSTLFLPDGAPSGGWTFYPPLSSEYGKPAIDFMILSIHMMGISSILAAINIIATIINMRCPGMTFDKMPIFAWSWLITAFLLIAIMPVLAGTVTMLLTDRHFGTSFFSAAGGGDALMFQHVFWFFGHPEVYVLILPAFGIISEIIPTFSRKKLFGYKSMIYAISVIAILSFVVWAHHMFTAGVSLGGQLFFMYTTMLVAVPTGIKVFNWVATMFRGSISYEPPMMFALAFIILFTIGGLTGLMLAIAPADYQYQDTYFVVAHFHYVLVSGTFLAILAGVYYWLPKWTGKMYCFKKAHWHFWLTIISFNVTFFPMHFLGLAGMPRRIPDYGLQFADFNLLVSIAAFVFGFSQLIFLWLIIDCIRNGKKVDGQVWDGAHGLEWTLDSPPPYHSFTTPPKLSN